MTAEEKLIKERNRLIDLKFLREEATTNGQWYLLAELDSKILYTREEIERLEQVTYGATQLIGWNG